MVHAIRMREWKGDYVVYGEWVGGWEVAGNILQVRLPDCSEAFLINPQVDFSFPPC